MGRDFCRNLKKYICGKELNMDWKRLEWDDLDVVLPGRLVLRHNKELQYGFTAKPYQTLGSALMEMQEYCKAHRDGNPRITGLIKVVEHTKINNVALSIKLTQMINKGSLLVRK
jgi:hypothetical protein